MRISVNKYGIVAVIYWTEKAIEGRENLRPKLSLIFGSVAQLEEGL